MADYKTPQWLLPNEKNLAYPAVGDGITGSGLSEDRHSLYSMDFTGSNTINYSTPVDLGVVSTFSFWMNIDVGTTGALFGNTALGTFEYVVYYSGSEFFFKIAGAYADFPNAAAAISTGQWHHVAFVRPSENEVQCYIDSTLTDTITSWNGTPGSNPIKFDLIGSRPGGGLSYSGKIDEICGFKRALSGTEVAALSVADAPANVMALPDKPYVYYPLGEQAQMGSANWSFPNGSLQSHVVDFSTQDYIQYPHININGAFTVSTWVKTTDTNTYGNLFSSSNQFGGDPSGGSSIANNWKLVRWNRSARFNASNSSNSIIFDVNTGTSGTRPNLYDGNWHHVLAIWDGTTNSNGVKIFFDGVLRGLGTASSTAINNDNSIPIRAGSSNATFDFIGEQSNQQIWNTALTYGSASADGDIAGGDVANVYNNGSPQSTYTVTPTAWWKLNAANSSYVYPWTMSITGNPDYTSSNDGCYISSGVLKWRDTGTAAFTDTFDWYSKEITGANTNITISSTGGEWQGESSSIGLRFFYKIDGGSWVQFQEETHIGGYSPTAWTLTAPAAQSSSSSFQLKVVGFGGASSNSYVTLNDITVTADAGTLYTESFTDADGTGFANGVYTPPPVDWTFIDSSGSNNGESDTLPTSALIPSDLQFESPYSNYSLDFDGVANYVDCGNDSSLQFSGSFTISTWAKANDSGLNAIISKNSSSSSGNGYHIDFRSGNSVHAWAYNANNKVTVTGLSTGVWYNIIFVFESTGGSNGNQSLYVNAATPSTNSITNFSTSTIKNLRIGDSEAISGTEMNGNIDEVAIWSSALTQAQVIQVYNNGYPNDLTSLSPSQWWRLGEDAYFVGNDITIPNQITGGQTGTGSGTQTAILVGDAPGSYANGSGTNLAVEDRIGDAPESTANSVSINMIPSNRISYPAGYLPTQVDNAFSMEFDGTNDYIEIANDTSLQITDNLTLSCWIYADNASGTNSIIDKFYDGADRSYMLRLQSTTIRLSLGNTSGSASVTYQSTATISNGAWYHIATTFSSADNEVKIYINGSLDSTHSKTDLISSNNQPLRIGTGYNLLNYFDGKIDEVAIFNYALSERQIKQDIYNGTTAGKTADLNNISNLTAPVAWYRMGD